MQKQILLIMLLQVSHHMSTWGVIITLCNMALALLPVCVNVAFSIESYIFALHLSMDSETDGGESIDSFPALRGAFSHQKAVIIHPLLVSFGVPCRLQCESYIRVV